MLLRMAIACNHDVKIEEPGAGDAFASIIQRTLPKRRAMFASNEFAIWQAVEIRTYPALDEPRCSRKGSSWAGTGVPSKHGPLSRF